MFTMKAFKYVLPFWITLLVVIVMTVTMSLINGGAIPFPGILGQIAYGTAIGYILGLVIPVGKWADAFAGLLKARQGSLGYTLAINLVYATFFTVVMSAAFTAYFIGFPPFFLSAVAASMPVGFAVGYVVGVLATPLAVKLSMAMCGKGGPGGSAEHQG